MCQYFEVDFRQVSDLDALRFQLDEMHTMRLRGKVDRVDLYQDGPSVYVKIIVSYKSGAKDIRDFTIITRDYKCSWSFIWMRRRRD